MPQFALHVISTVLLALCSSIACAASSLYQLVLPFPNEREVSYSYSSREHSITIELANTPTHELKSIEHYDEDYIRRVLIKDLGPKGSEIKLYIKNTDTQALINTFQEPFRLVVDLFPKDFDLKRDPITSLPLTVAPTTNTVENSSNQPESKKPASEPIAAGKKQEEAAPTRKLLQPAPHMHDDPNALAEHIKEIPAGPGKHWQTFPPYIYRLQEIHADSKQQQPALKDTQAFAHLAGSLFDQGHDARALVAYQHVLFKEPSIFERDALHLWKFAEANLGHGNVNLARGYYQNLIEKHPSGPLAAFAKLRLLDTLSVKAYSEQKPEMFKELADKVHDIRNNDPELKNLIALRDSYWKNFKESNYEATTIPEISSDQYAAIDHAHRTTNNSKTAFYAATIKLAYLLNENTPWQASTGDFAQKYFDRFSGKTATAFQGQLKKKINNKLHKHFMTLLSQGNASQVVKDYEALPSQFAQVSKDPTVAWAVAEGYRTQANMAVAISHYQNAAKDKQNHLERFKATFWVAAGSDSLLSTPVGASLSQNERRRHQNLRSTYDRNMDDEWKRLSSDNQSVIINSMRSTLEESLEFAPNLKTPPKLVLAAWKHNLTTSSKIETSVAKSQPVQSPTNNLIVVMTKLADRFGKLGMPNEKQEAIKILRSVNPEELAQHKDAQALWQSEMLKLADEYRQANEYLDAGNIYTTVADQASNWHGRAEAYYKGGLLLYRAGRRQEAIASFKKASEDANNMFYANLAKERLAQLESLR